MKDGQGSVRFSTRAVPVVVLVGITVSALGVHRFDDPVGWLRVVGAVSLCSAVLYPFVVSCVACRNRVVSAVFGLIVAGILAWGVTAFALVLLKVSTLFGGPGARGWFALSFAQILLSLLAFELAAEVLSIGKVFRERVRSVGLVGMAVAATLVAVETLAVPLYSLRSLEIRPREGSDASAYRLHPKFGMTLTPGFRGELTHREFRGVPVEINAHGFRDRRWKVSSSGPPEGFRVLGLGDSFVFGLGVAASDVFLRRLENRFPSIGIRTFNTGVPGYGPGHELQVLQSYAEVLVPHVIVMTLFTGNDLENDLQRKRTLERLQSEKTEGEGLEEVYRRLYRERSDRRPSVTSILKRLAEPGYWWRSSRLYRMSIEAGEQLASRFGWVSPRLAFNDFLVRSCALDPDPEVKEALKIVVDHVAGAARFAQERGAQFVVLLAPPRILVNVEEFDRVFENYPRYDRGSHSPDVLHARLGEALSHRGVEFLDLLPVLRAAGVETYHREGHWNERGHRHVATALAEFLRGRRWMHEDAVPTPSLQR